MEKSGDGLQCVNDSAGLCESHKSQSSHGKEIVPVHSSSQDVGTVLRESRGCDGREEVDEQGDWVTYIGREADMRRGRTCGWEASGPIFRKVAHKQRRVNPAAYTPSAFSFGPYHAKLKRSEQDSFKLSSLSQLKEGQFSLLVEVMMRNDFRVRALYEGSELEAIQQQTLAYLLALDAVCIVAAYLYDEWDPPLYDIPLLYSFWGDSMLMENQIPLFVLEYAFEREWLMESHVDTKNKHLQKLVDRFVGIHSPFDGVREWKLTTNFDKRQPLLGCLYKALTARTPSVEDTKDCFRIMNTDCALFSSNSSCFNIMNTDCALCRSNSSNVSTETAGPGFRRNMSTASRLRKYGIHFRGRNSNFTGISFDEGTLILPKISIGDDTQRLLLNILAYEQKDLRISAINWAVTSYISLMDGLINKEEDVDILVESGVIVSWLGSHKEVADMWNELCKNVTIYFTTHDTRVLQNIEEHCKVTLNRVVAGFWEAYWEKRPWLLVSIVAATLLLVLSFLQTFYTMKPYM